MNRKCELSIILLVGIGMGIGAGAFAFQSSPIIEEKIVIVDLSPELESRLHSEIESNQSLSQMVSDVINACNEKMLDKYNSTEEKLKKRNQILSEALSEFRNT